MDCMGDGFEPDGCKIMITQWPHHHTWSGYAPVPMLPIVSYAYL